MNFLKHYLTLEEEKKLKLYLEMIDSGDIESARLAESLFYEEFKKYRYKIILRGKIDLDVLNFPNTSLYWRNRILDMLDNGCYY